MDMNTIGKMWLLTTMALMGGCCQEAKAEANEQKPAEKPAEAKAEAAEPKAEAKAEAKTEAKAETAVTKTEGKTEVTKTPNGETTITRNGNSVVKHHREVNDIKDENGKVIGHQTIEYTTETYNEPEEPASEEPEDCKCVCHQQKPQSEPQMRREPRRVIYYVRDPFDDFDVMPMPRPRSLFWEW